MARYRTNKQMQFGDRILELARRGYTYEQIHADLGCGKAFVGRYVRAHREEVNAPRNQPRKRAFNLERQLKKITLPMPEAFMEPLKEILEAKWSINYLTDMNVPSSVKPRLHEQYQSLEIKSEPVLEAHGEKLKPETLLLEDEFKNILKAAIAYQVHLYASFPGIPPETVEEITQVMFEGKPEEIKIVEWLLKFQPWVDQDHFNYWKKFRKNIGGK